MHECPNTRAYYENQGKRVSFKDGSFCSTGWLERFKQRHSIVFGRVIGEEGSVSEDMVSD